MASKKGGRRPGAGRKPIPRSEHRRNQVSARFTDAEIELLQRAAGDKSLGTWLRDLALASARRRARKA